MFGLKKQLAKKKNVGDNSRMLITRENASLSKSRVTQILCTILLTLEIAGRISDCNASVKEIFQFLLTVFRFIL